MLWYSRVNTHSQITFFIHDIKVLSVDGTTSDGFLHQEQIDIMLSVLGTQPKAQGQVK